MCGIAGIAGHNISQETYRAAIGQMTGALAHRGPDNEGIWNDSHCFLGHRRLSIIDLSDAGNQPFLSSDGRYVLVYNGELYNYRELKLELQRAPQGSGQLPYFFRTGTDTEVILAAYLRWGIECLQRFNGMFAFAIWDTQEQRLLVARDRLGVKPLYYQFKDQVLIFASEIRALMQSGLTSKKASPAALAEYLQYATVHAPNTILEGVLMLMPGTLLEYKQGVVTVSEYWNLNRYAKGREEISYEDTCKRVNHLLTASVERRLVADVPFGAFLSGGIDSSAVVGLMAKVSSKKVKTFNVSFDEGEFSEAVYARQIASRFGTEHHEIRLTPSDFLQQLPGALMAMDHPGGDGPNSYIVSKATKEAGITMALSGIGGDELFAGYDIFKRFHELERKAWLNLIPGFGRSLGGKILAARKRSVQGDKTAEILALNQISGFHAYPVNRKLFNRTDYQAFLKERFNDDAFIANVIRKSETDKSHRLSRVSLFEIQTYMQNVLLRDTDQMSMAVALEVREPFLDYQLVEFVLGVPDVHKYPHTPKKLLVDALGDLLPDAVVNRPKMGFVLPWKDWLKNELKDFCEENLVQLSKREFLNRDAVLLTWNRFLNGDPRITWSRVWHLVVLNHWLKTHQVEC